jgi:mannitol-1-/sugar-/sorbitol-6-phosphatase
METIQCGALLFDLDGVLVDSTPAVTRVWKAWAFEHGIDGEQLVRVAHGRTNLSTIQELLPNGDYEVEARKVEQREIEDVDGLIPLPGALELLKILPMNRWAVVTSCSRPVAEARIRAAGLPLPKHFITSSEIVRSKPDPEAYLLGAKSVGFAATDCVVIEDAPAGIRSGKAAGAQVVGVGTTGKHAELASAGADWIVENCLSLSLLCSDETDRVTLTLKSL